MLLNVAVTADVLFAVTVVAVAAGTVPEFQLRVADVGFSTDGTPVCIGGFGSSFAGLMRSGIEGDDFGFLLRRFFELPLCVDSPGQGKYIQHIFSEEQEIVCQRNNREEVIGERIADQIDQHNNQVEQRKDPGFYRDDEKQKELRVGEQCGITEEQA